MPIPDSDFDDFSIMVDPIKGRISLICPAPIIGFNTIGDFKEFVLMLESWIPALEGRIVNKEGVITREIGEQADSPGRSPVAPVGRKATGELGNAESERPPQPTDNAPFIEV